MTRPCIKIELLTYDIHSKQLRNPKHYLEQPCQESNTVATRKTCTKSEHSLSLAHIPGT